MLEVTAVQDIAFMITICEKPAHPIPTKICFSQKSVDIYLLPKILQVLKMKDDAGKKHTWTRQKYGTAFPRRLGTVHSAGCQKKRCKGSWVMVTTSSENNCPLGTREAAQNVGACAFTQSYHNPRNPLHVHPLGAVSTVV